jgi:tetratricopeptide (TPR) repeat protein
MNFEKWKHYLRARLFHMMNKDDAALREYQFALQAAPDFSRAAACSAFIHARQGNYTAAATHFHTALSIDPLDAEMYFNLGYSYDKNGARNEALDAFKMAVKLNPKLDRAWYGLGMCHATLGDHSAAAAALQEAALLQPMNPHAWYALGMAYHHLHDTEKVKEIIFNLHRFDPKMTRQLIHDTERSDLAYLVADLVI